MEYLNNLNEKQREAALKTEGPLLILAGAGSGKTSTMTRRIAHLVKGMGVNPYNILAVTFTNKAANEMRERVESLLESQVNMWIMTFHAACLRILRQNAEVLNYTSSFVVYDPVDQKAVMKSIIKEEGLDEKKFPVQMLLSSISKAKEEELTPQKYRVKFGDTFKGDIISRVFESYERILKKNNAMDFDDLLLNTVRLFERDEEVLLKYQNRFQYIMVDEYQDTNKIQYKFIQMLAEKNKNLCVVGDDDQCIYQWRGADISNILNFEKDFKGATVIKLEQNYRSTKNILAAAHSVIENNRERKDKKLWTDAEDGKKIVYHRADDEKMEAYYIAQEIDRLKGPNCDYKDFAILYRTNSQSRTFEEALSRRDIPYRVVGGTRYYDRKEIKDIVSYMRLVANPADDLALTRIINSPKRGIGGVTVDKLQALAKVRNCSFFDVLTDEDIVESLSQKASKGVIELVDAIRKYHDERENLGVSDIYKGLLRDTGYLKALEDANNIEAEGRIENLYEFESVIIDFEKDGELSLSEFLEKIALMSDIDNHNTSENAVSLMTMHSAKGLEFPFVFIPGMEDGLFPGWRSMEEPNGLEEERRLCYVGMTRAKERLCLTSANYRMIFGKGSYTRESQFMRELDPKLLDGDGVYQKKNEVKLGEARSFDGFSKETSYKPFNQYKAARQEVKKVMPKENFSQGDKVSHKKFGEGTVISTDGKVASIMFASVGIKKLSLDVAPLKKL
ncbi:MAG: 3'-5' exonuclease [Anaerovoracaceae bacterium]